MVRQKCAPKMLKEFDDSLLHVDFFAKRTLVNAWTARLAGEIADRLGPGPPARPLLHGGPGKVPVEIQA
jgi:hypothetical protein